MSTIYILQKDTPVSKNGDEFEWSEKAGVYRPKGELFLAMCIDAIYGKETVENNPEWFLPKEKDELNEFIDKINEPKYSEADMRLCFKAAKYLTAIGESNKTFEDYINSLK